MPILLFHFSLHFSVLQFKFKKIKKNKIRGRGQGWNAHPPPPTFTGSAKVYTYITVCMINGVFFLSVSDLSIISDAKLLYRVTHTGEVEWEQPRMFTTHCRVDITFYPFDTQLCHIKLTSWGYTTDEIELQPAYSEILTEDLEYVTIELHHALI